MVVSKFLALRANPARPSFYSTPSWPGSEPGSEPAGYGHTPPQGQVPGGGVGGGHCLSGAQKVPAQQNNVFLLGHLTESCFSNTVLGNYLG